MAIDRGVKDVEVDAEELLRELELRLDRLKILYEQYFMGIEKIEPQTARKDVNRRILELSQRQLRNAQMRYRVNALNQKYGVYSTYWSRTLRAIENGTYYRSIVKAGREAIKKGLEVPDEVLRALPERMRARILKERDLALSQAHSQGKLAVQKPPITGRPSAREILGEDDDDAFEANFEQLFDGMSAEKPKTAQPAPAARPARATSTVALPIPEPTEFSSDDVTSPFAPSVAPAPEPRSPARPTATPLPRSPVLPPGMSEERGRDLFQKYVQAKQVVGEATEALTYDSVMSSLARQAPRIMDAHNARSVDFSVVIRDGKVILKATPRK